MRTRSVCALALGALLTATGSAAADHDRVDAREAALFGVEHAAEHARQRAIAQAAPAPPAARAADEPRTPPGAVAATSGGSWSQPAALPVIAINAAMLPTGKVLMFAYPARPGYPGYENLARAYVWDPRTGESRQVDPPIDPATGQPTNIWCGGTSFLADGRVLVTGGNVGDPLTDFHGLDTIFAFDPFEERWVTHRRMAQGRWYPSQLLIPDGRTIILSGLTKPGDRDHTDYVVNRDVEVFSPGGELDVVENLRLGDPGNPPPLDMYPHTFWMPGGHALVAGPQRDDTFRIGVPRREGDTDWRDLPDLSIDRHWSTAVKLAGKRVMVLGGSGPAGTTFERHATDTTEILDDGRPDSGWRPGPRMTVGRSHANSVLLPDGTVATIGGGFGEVDSEYYRWEFDERHRHVELYDPRTGRVRVGAAQAEGRTYHSVALLLPDGRVLSAGDDINGTPTTDHPTGAGTGTHEDTAEIYSPPYLFRGARPRLVAAPRRIAHGRRFTVRTRGRIERAVLVAPGAVTHAVDMNQRIVRLGRPKRRGAGRFALRAPASANAAPPGYYMLFVLNRRGVPSVARFVHLR